MEKVNYPVFEYEGMTFQWTDRKTENGDFVILRNGADYVVSSSEDVDGWLFVTLGGRVFDDCEGMAEDGKFIGAGHPQNDDRMYHIEFTYPTLKEAYTTSQELFEDCLEYSMELCEFDDTKIASPYDIIMSVNPKTFKVTPFTDEEQAEYNKD